MDKQEQNIEELRSEDLSLRYVQPDWCAVEEYTLQD